jgi:hypothetical protein
MIESRIPRVQYRWFPALFFMARCILAMPDPGEDTERSFSIMTAPTNLEEPDRVRAFTNPEALRKIDETIEQRVRFYATQPREVISRRIAELEREWDMERWLETNASTLALGSLIVGLAGKKKCLLLSVSVLSFLLLHSVKGWCPPVPVLRRLGVRTRTEIDREKFALKILRGDFQNVSTNPSEMKESIAKTDPAPGVIQAVKS